MINLSPLPRYHSLCCVEPTHGLQGNENPGILITLLRDVGVYMGRHGPLNWSDHLDVVISPMDCVGPSVFLYQQISKDNVHPTGEFLASLACAMLLIRKKSRSEDFPGASGLLPSELSFSNFLRLETERRRSGRTIPDERNNTRTIRSISLFPIPFSLNNMSFLQKDILQIKGAN